MIGTRAVAGFIEVRDFRLMRRVHRWRPPLWVRLWMLGASRLGDGWIWYGLGLIILLRGGPARFAAVGTSALAAFGGILLFRALKRISGRKRPCALEPHCWANILPPDQYSFPSGHSITAFAIVIPLSLFYPHLMDVLLFLAVSIALSRILLGMHFLSDVLAGALIGAGLGYSSYVFLHWLRFS
jgi:undecaprenyl-diphosphatase